MKKDLSKGCWISGQGWDGMNTCTHNPVSSRNFTPTSQAVFMTNSSSLGNPAGIAGWSTVEHLPSIWEALDLTPEPQKGGRS